MSSDLINASLS